MVKTLPSTDKRVLLDGHYFHWPSSVECKTDGDRTLARWLHVRCAVNASYPKTNHQDRLKPLFLVVNRFETNGFPVRVRHFQLGRYRSLGGLRPIGGAARKGIRTSV